MNKKHNKNSTELTRGTKKIIAEAIKEAPDVNRSEICDIVCKNLCDRFTGKSLEYQLKRMNLEKTNDVINAIDTYIFKCVKNKHIIVDGAEEISKNS